jgi:drug/metabolite transporter (DMT)-like permease
VTAAGLSRAQAVTLLVLASVGWSLGGLAVKLAAMDPMAFAFLRALFAGLALLLLLPMAGGILPPLRWIGLAALLYCANVTLVIVAMSRGTAAAGILLQYTGPVFCALLAWMLQGRRLTRANLISMALAMIGVAIMVAGGGLGGDWLVPACGLASGVMFAGLILVIETISRRCQGRENAVLVVCLNNLIGAVLLFPLVLAFSSMEFSTRQLGIVMITGLVQLALPYVLFQLAMRAVSSVEASLLVLLEPVLNPVWVWAIVGEAPGWAVAIGGAFLISALVAEAVLGSREKTGPSLQLEKEAGPVD